MKITLCSLQIIRVTSIDPKEHYKCGHISYHYLKKICPNIPYFKNEDSEKKNLSKV
jgi:hypothetical protein